MRENVDQISQMGKNAGLSGRLLRFYCLQRGRRIRDRKHGRARLRVREEELLGNNMTQVTHFYFIFFRVFEDRFGWVLIICVHIGVSLASTFSKLLLRQLSFQLYCK